MGRWRRYLAWLAAAALAAVPLSLPAPADGTTTPPIVNGGWLEGLTDIYLHGAYVMYGLSPTVSTATDVDIYDEDLVVTRVTASYIEPDGTHLEDAELTQVIPGDVNGPDTYEWSNGSGRTWSVGTERMPYGLWTVAIAAYDAAGNVVAQDSRTVDCRDPAKAAPVHVLRLRVSDPVGVPADAPMGGTDFRLWVLDPDHVIWNAVVSDKVRGWPRTHHKAVTVHRKGDKIVFHGPLPARNVVTRRHHAIIYGLGLKMQTYDGEPMPRSLVHGLPYSGPYWRLTH